MADIAVKRVENILSYVHAYLLYRRCYVFLKILRARITSMTNIHIISFSSPLLTDVLLASHMQALPSLYPCLLAADTSQVAPPP